MKLFTKNKSHSLIKTILSLVLIFSLASSFTNCKSINSMLGLKTNKSSKTSKSKKKTSFFSGITDSITGFFSRDIGYYSFYQTPKKRKATWSCRSKETMSTWYLLFGAISLGRLDENELYKANADAFRIHEYKTGWDLAITIFLGTFTSVTKSTLEIKKCNLKNSRPTTKKRNNPVSTSINNSTNSSDTTQSNTNKPPVQYIDTSVKKKEMETGIKPVQAK